MSLLKFIADRDVGLVARVPSGRYLIVDYGREGWDAIYVPTGGAEIALPPSTGGRFHKASRHAMASCELHRERQLAPELRVDHK